MEKSIYGYILRYSKRQQVMLTIMAIASFPFLYAFYEVPKQIINHIGAAAEKKGVTFNVEAFGFEMDSITYLFFKDTSKKNRVN